MKLIVAEWAYSPGLRDFMTSIGYTHGEEIEITCLQDVFDTVQEFVENGWNVAIYQGVKDPSTASTPLANGVKEHTFTVFVDHTKFYYR